WRFRVMIQEVFSPGEVVIDLDHAWDAMVSMTVVQARAEDGGGLVLCRPDNTTTPLTGYKGCLQNGLVARRVEWLGGSAQTRVPGNTPILLRRVGRRAHGGFLESATATPGSPSQGEARQCVHVRCRRTNRQSRRRTARGGPGLETEHGLAELRPLQPRR